MNRLVTRLIAVVGMILSFALLPAAAQATTVHCGDVITQNTTLDADVLGCTGVAISIQGDNVVLNLNGHTVEGTIDAPLQPAAPWRDIEVLNGAVKNGDVRFSYGDHGVARNLRMANGSIEASDVGHEPAAFVAEDNTVIQGRIVAFNGSTARLSDNVVKGGSIVLAKARGSITRNRVENATDSALLISHGTGSVSRNVVRNSRADGIEIYFAGNAEVRENFVYGSAAVGIANDTYANSNISGNLVRANGAGISVSSLSSAHIAHNVITANVTDGVHVNHEPDFVTNATIVDNRIDRNGGDGVRTDAPNTTVSGNHTWFNGNLGIEAVPGTLGGDNWAKHNGNPLQCVPETLCSTTEKPKQ